VGDRVVAGGAVVSAPLSPRAERILRAIEDYRDVHQFAPTLREIGEMVDIPHKSVVNHHLNMLANLGKIRRVPNTARGIVVTDRDRSHGAYTSLVGLCEAMVEEAERNEGLDADSLGEYLNAIDGALSAIRCKTGTKN
jgi:SOS-response transcriptional repressor LexA